MFLVNAFAGSISLAPQHHVLCRLAAADTLVRDVLLLQRNAAGTYAGNFLDLVLAGFVTAPHCFYKTVALFFQSLGDLVHGLADIGLVCPVFQCLPEHALRHH